MRAQIKQIKALSNTIVIQISEEQNFLEFLQTYIKKHFSTTLFLKKSMLIFAKDTEKYKRQALLLWLGGIFDRNNTNANAIKITPSLLKNLHLPITIQIAAASAIESSTQVFVAFEKSTIIFRHYFKNSLFFSFLKTYLKNAQIKEKVFELSIDLSTCPEIYVQNIKKLFSKKIFLAGKQYNLVFNRKVLEKFFADINDHKQSVMSSSENELSELLKEFGCKDGEELGAIKRRYFELAKMYHPDRVHGQEEEIVKKYEQKFIRIKDIYESICELYSQREKMAA